MTGKVASDRCRTGRSGPSDAAGPARPSSRPMSWSTTVSCRRKSWRWCPRTSAASMSARCRSFTRCRRRRSTSFWSSLALQGLNVARLKGGDPLIFGRGSEEAAALREAGISVTYVPGITAAQGCGRVDRRAADPSRACHRCALCHRAPRQGCSRSISTGRALHLKQTTLVVYMGAANIAEICRPADARIGLPAALPVLAVSCATTPRETRLVSDAWSHCRRCGSGRP